MGDPMPRSSPDELAWLAEIPPEHRDKIDVYRASGPPSPMLAQPSEPSEVPTGWGFQRKWDGMRVLARAGAQGPRLWARSGRDVTSTFPDLADELAGVDREAIVDGEVVVLVEGSERFDRLQRRMHVEEPSRALLAEIPVQWAVFDVLQLDGRDVRGLPQRHREQLIPEQVRELDRVIEARTVAHGRPPGQAREAACELGWEGLIAKDPASTYREGRHRAWRKLKCWQRATFVVVGYRDLEPGGGVGSLVLAELEEDELRPVGSVGTGLTDDERTRLRDRLQPLRREEPPLTAEDVRGEVHWVEPAFVTEVAYAERTPEGQLRHPRLPGLAGLAEREASP